MFQKLAEVELRFDDLDRMLADPEMMGNRKRYTEIAKERASLVDIVDTYRIYKGVLTEVTESEELLGDDDPEMRGLAREELTGLRSRQEKLENRLKKLLLPKDPRDEKNIILEIRQGTGGDEAALFAADLFRMYSRYAEAKGWKVELLSLNETGLGGIKELAALMSGKMVYSHLKYESGVHRVQRVPETETQGRIHTSAVTVAILPEAEDVDVNIRDDELKIDTYRASGAGGQHVNTTDSAIRITHLPTNLVITCQDERSQHKNKAKALKILRSKLFELYVDEQQREERDERRSQIGSGDRSERIRTYNFPQNRLTDHRIGLTLYKLDAIMEGNLEETFDSLRTYFQAEAMKGTSD
jgi:peptide chain release factor 1